MSDTTNFQKPPGWNSLGRSQFGQPSVAAFGQPGSAPLPQPASGGIMPPSNPLLAGAAAPGAAPGNPPVVAQAPPGQVLPVGLPRANVPPMPNANPLSSPQALQAYLGPQGMPEGVPAGFHGNIMGQGAPGAPAWLAGAGGPAERPQLQSRPGMTPQEWQAHVASLYPAGGAGP